MICQNYIAHIC